MTTAYLQSHLSALTASHKQINVLIERLQSLPATPGQGDEARIELGAEIHQELKSLKDDMELLRVEIDQIEKTPHGHRNRVTDAETDRLLTLVGKLEEDLNMYGIIHWILFFTTLCARLRHRANTVLVGKLVPGRNSGGRS